MRSALLLMLLMAASFVVAEGVVASAVPQESSEPARYRAVRELSVGEVDGQLALTRVEQIVIDGSRVLVSQPAERLIRILSAESGEIVGQLGGAGEGPGEMQRLTWLGLFGDTVALLDDRLRRTTAFDPDGSVIGTWSFDLPPISLPRFWTPMALTRDWNPVAPVAFAIQAEERPDQEPWVLLDPDGVVLDTMAQVSLRGASIILRREGGASAIRRPIHRADRRRMAVDGSRFVVASDENGRGLSLFVYDTVERTTREFDLGVPPVPVDPQTADRIMGPVRNAILGRELDRGVDRREFEEALAGPEWIPAVDEMFVTADGETWLREPAFSGLHHLWRVVSPDGVIEAEVEVPFGVVLRDRAGDHVWGYRRDPELHFYIVERFRLTRVEDRAE